MSSFKTKFLDFVEMGEEKESLMDRVCRDFESEDEDDGDSGTPCRMDFQLPFRKKAKNPGKWSGKKKAGYWEHLKPEKLSSWSLCGNS